jgi:hypothetical protein
MWQTTRNGILSSAVALSLTIALIPTSEALNPINSTQDGRIIQGGTYYNTAGNTTSFINSQSGGLWLKAGTTLRGLEVNSSGAVNNNGGTVHLYAPDNVVRVDGNIDVSAIRNGQGADLGNGGKVFIDSGYLFQNGNIFANGANGGLVQVNVNGMTLGAGAQIQAKGSTGAGGVVAINSAGPVDLRRNSVVDTSGKVVGSFDTNLINIEGGLVNNEGTLRADGVNSRGGTIRLVATGQSPYQDIKDNLQAATINPPGDTSAPTISSSERTFLLQRTKGLIDNHEGEIFLSRDTSSSTPAFISNLSANGTGGNADPNNDYSQSGSPRAGDGGNINLLAKQGIQNLGTIKANGAAGASGASPINGGNGGTTSFVSQAGTANTQGRLEANGGNGGASTGTSQAGRGGDGGLMAFSYNTAMNNTGGIYADGALGGNGSNPGRGGNGGLIVFSGDNNPTGNGSIDVIARPGGNNNLNLGGKSGTIVSSNPGTLGQSQAYFQQGYVNGQLVRTSATQQTQPVELLTHAENLMLLTKNGGDINVSQNLFDRLLQARIRSVTDPTGSLGQAKTEVINKNTASSPYVYRNLILGSSRDNLAMDMTHPWDNDGGMGNGELVFPSPLSMGEGFSTLNTLSIANDGAVSTQYLQYAGGGDTPYKPTNFWLIGRNSNPLGGGRLSALVNGNMDNLNVFGTTGAASGGSVNIATQGRLLNSASLTTSGGALHGGSIMLKSGNDIVWDNQIYYGLPTMSANGGLMGGTIRILPARDFNYQGAVYVTSINADGSLQGGMINVNAGRDSIITNSDFGSQPTLTANGTSSTLGRGGFIHINAGNNNVHSDASFQATGGLANGTVLFTTNP